MTPGGPDLPPGDGSLIIAAPSATLEHLQQRANELGAVDLFVDTMLPALYPVCIAYSVDPTIAAAQSFHETGGGKFGRAVTPAHRNYAGIKIKRPVGPDDNPDDHARFATWTEGAQAQCSHLRAYCSVPIEPPLQDKSPRSIWVWPHHYGITRVQQLGGKWAPSQAYGDRIADVAKRLMA